MKTEDLLETVDALLARDSDNREDDRNCESACVLQPISYEHERFLVAWVLLTSFHQDQLDRAWRKHGKKLAHFANCLLTSFCNGSDIFVLQHHVSKNEGHCFFFHACCTRLVAQVTARLTAAPSKELRHTVYNSWKNLSTLETVKNIAETSSANEAAILHSITIPLCVDVYNAFIAWMDQDSVFLSSNLILGEVWKVPVLAHTRLKELPEQENGEKGQDSKDKMEPKFQDNEISMIYTVLKSVVGTSSKEETSRSDAAHDDMYTVGQLQRLVFVIFELKGADCTSFDLVKTILLWNTNSRHEVFDPDLRILWDGWLMKTVGQRIAEKTNSKDFLRDPEVMGAIQKLSMAHAVSPTSSALRPMAWQSFSRILKLYGWKSIQKSSIENSVCTWCRLACGEWKIQLEEDGFSECCDKLSILDGCGNLIISIVQYLVEFHDSPHKTIPLKTESVLNLKQALEDTLSLTSSYLNTHLSEYGDIESTIVIHLWSELFSEINPSSFKDRKNVYECFRNLLSTSNEECLLKASLHVISAYGTDDAGGLDNEVIDLVILQVEKFWTKMTKMESLSTHNTIQSACVATEILAEYQPEKIQNVINAIFEAVDFLTKSVAEMTDLQQSLRLLVDTCVLLSHQFKRDLSEEPFSSKLSYAIKTLQNEQ